MRIYGILAVVLFFALSACTVSSPFEGPGFDEQEGVTVEGSDRLVVAVTNGELRGGSDLRARFWDHVSRVEATLAARPGYMGHSKRRELFGDQVWTLSVWRDEASLEDFVRSDVHQTAISEGMASLKTARFARFEIERKKLPITWERALTALETNARGYD